MCNNDSLGSVEIDLNDSDTMAFVQEMRNAKPDKEARRKIYLKQYNAERSAEMRKYKAKYRVTHQEQIKKARHEYNQRPEVREHENEKRRIRYHTDPAYRERVLARKRARRENMTPEELAEYRRKQAEYSRKSLAKKKAKRKRRQARKAKKQAMEWKNE